MTQLVTRPLSPRERAFVITLDRVILSGLRHWLFIVNLLFGIFVGLPWLAPVFVRTGQLGPARAIYFFYSTQCHQLPQRSFFLFGAKPTYSLTEIQTAWQDTDNPYLLRQFVGNTAMGWKVAWSDRMVSMYTSIFFGGLLYGLVRKRLKPLSFWAFIIFAVLPMLMDGGTHLLSDLAGLGNGFRDSNAWLAWLTGNIFPPTFYAGDALGSFNSWMRLLTGTLFGIGCVWLAYPYLEQGLSETVEVLEAKLRGAGVLV